VFRHLRAELDIEVARQPKKLPRLRHFLFTWLKTHGIDDAHIQPYSGHASRTSLEIYSRLALTDAQTSYNNVINQFPV
jgi:integrase/recombinase XerD